MVQSRRDSNQSQFQSLSGQGSFQTVQSEELRSEETNGNRSSRFGSLIINWSGLFSKMRPTQQQNALVHSFQKRPALNADTTVALLEFIILALSLIQLELTFRSPFWREFSPYLLEIIYTVIFPYPGLETFSSTALFALSIAAAFRTICWRHLLYFPYPIREKVKVTSFSGNLEFTYPEFVLKKVLDDDPLKKIGMISALFAFLCSYLLHVMETLNGPCVWIAATASETAGHFDCAELSLHDSLWFTVMTFLKVGYGDIVVQTQGGRALVACTSCLMIALCSMFFSIVIKKFQFSSMEARVHSFLFRRNLYAQKDLSAVMAVQATYRFNMSYRGSLIWHQQGGSNQVYFRPLSARLPNEVKKKLYISRFQTRLKEILKFNTDGDPINAFSKHIEVITASLGVTLIEMTMLKKIYHRRNRIQRERQRKVLHAASVKLTRSDLASVAPMAAVEASESRLKSCIAFKAYTPLSDNEPAIPESAVSPPLETNLEQAPRELVVANATWQQRMQQRAEETMRLLQKIEMDAKDIVEVYDSCE